MGATTILIRGYVVKQFPHLRDKGLLVASRIATLSITGIALLLGFFVVEILRNVTEIAVLLSSVVILVLLGRLIKHSSRLGGFLSLLSSVALLALFIFTGWAKRVHPFWVVVPATVLIISFFTWMEGRKKKRSSPL
jgi:4-amino-4-deoxy-L-arabinose transferase-like glycosyltransferase